MDRNYLLEKLEKLEKRYGNILNNLEFHLWNLFSPLYLRDELRYLESEIREIRKIL